MGSVIAFFTDPCGNSGEVGRTICKLFATDPGEPLADFYAMWANAAYLFPAFIDFFPLCSLIPSLEQYRRGTTLIVFMLISFWHHFEGLIHIDTPDDLPMRADIIMGTYVACDTALMAADFDFPYTEWLYSFALLGLSIIQYFGVTGYGARTWAYFTLPTFTALFGLAQRWDKTRRTAGMHHGRVGASQIGMMAVCAMVPVACIVFAIGHAHQDMYVHGSFHIISAFLIALLTYVLRMPYESVASSYASGFSGDSASLASRLTKAEKAVQGQRANGYSTIRILETSG